VQAYVQPYLCFHGYYEYCEYSRCSGFHGYLVELPIKFYTLSSFVTCHQICNTIDATAYPSWVHELTLCFVMFVFLNSWFSV